MPVARLLIAVIASLSPIGMDSLLLPADALPFRENCQSMAAYFNTAFKVNKSGETLRFSNFSYATFGKIYPLGSFGENRLSEGVYCGDGFVTITGPQGTKVCKAELFYYISKKRGSYQYDNCRWR